MHAWLPSTAAATAAPTEAQPISLSDRALSHLKKLREEVGGSALLLRVGVRQGGCSGMSYQMDYVKPDEIKEDDYIADYDAGSFKLVSQHCTRSMRPMSC